jgi:predicted Zn-dependent protease
MVANNYEPGAGITLQEKFMKLERGARLPFLSGHPSSEERIQILKALIELKNPQ